MAAVTLGDGKYSFSGRTQDTSLPVLLFYVSSQAASLLTTNSVDQLTISVFILSVCCDSVDSNSIQLTVYNEVED